ncbi:hypothetical protein K438DRAFT_1787335 [Mycena galopus ATCC 62051]|nr:hypothetical protein K438DRAFT_1787335 [Mycena galopus ATCC 62051]
MPPSQSKLRSNGERKRVYVACIPCRKRKTDLASINGKCQRCMKKGLYCEYIPVCEQRERALFTAGYESDESSRSSSSIILSPNPSQGYGALPRADPNSNCVRRSHYVAPEPSLAASLPSLKPSDTNSFSPLYWPPLQPTFPNYSPQPPYHPNNIYSTRSTHSGNLSPLITPKVDAPSIFRFGRRTPQTPQDGDFCKSEPYRSGTQPYRGIRDVGRDPDPIEQE